MMFPYPSAEGLHVGNMYAFVHSDAYGRFKRLQGYDVFEPIGLDGFGIHSENYAIKIGEHIKDVSARTEKHFYEQLHQIGNAYDWSRTVETYKPDYYKWTQWLFLKMYDKGLAYRKKSAVNWCPSCKTVLSDEQVIDNRCERCDTKTEIKEMEQWFWRITDYAEKLLKNLEKIDWPEEVKTIQRNWIGKSEGALIKFSIFNFQFSNNNQFSISNSKKLSELEVFTTRPDTLFGCTYMVISPEHPALENWKLEIGNWDKVEKYIKKAKKKSEIERKNVTKEKTGVKLEGIMAINPANNEEIPVFVADYVLMDYGTGAIMAVPAHDERDWKFAKKYKLPIKYVVHPTVFTNKVSSNKWQTYEGFSIKDGDKEGEEWLTKRLIKEDRCVLEFGKSINSKFLTGLYTSDAIQKMIVWLEKNKLGKRTVNYKLRDWCVSRQRYWGPPIPMVYCPVCGWQPVAEKDLPVLLPEMDDFLPDGSGKGPLNKIKEFVNTTCPKCGGQAKRETDVSDPFVDSAWYFMRYLDAYNSNEPFAKSRAKKWLPVDMYIGGKEHSVLHLLYSRFVNMVLHELGFTPTEEPYKKFRAHGLLIAEGAKISKSKGNIINPDEYIEKFGADAVRMYLMFLGDMRQGGDWRDTGMAGMSKFIGRIWKMKEKITNNQETSSKQIQNSKFKIQKLLHKTIKGVSEDLENLKHNTAIAKLMIFVNEAQARGCGRDELGKFAILLAPFAPHLAEELWHQLGNRESVFKQKWPEYDKKLARDETIELVLQINGKVRDKIEVAADISTKEAEKLARESAKIKKWTKGKKIVKVIFVKGRLVNVVVG